MKSRQPGTKPRRLATIAIVLIVAALAAGLVADIRAFDRTSGGHEPPYTNFTGTPIDWSEVATTEQGMRKAGYIVDVEVNCTSGMIHLNIFGLRIPFRELSPRALVVHKPRAACVDRGFSPAFS